MRKCLLKLRTRSKIACKYALHWLSVQGKLYLRGIPQLIIVGALLFPIAYFTDKYIEAVFQIIALFSLRYKFSKTYHASTTMKCTFLTLSIGYLAIPHIVPIHNCLLSAMIVSFAIAFLSWFAQEYIDKKRKVTQLKKEAQDSLCKFSLYDCTKDEFYSHCLSKNVKNDRIEYVWDILRSQLSVNELAEKYFVEPQTIKQDRWRYKKKLLDT